MVRLSKQKQEKLENIMNLVEELGVDRVLARLRQTKMMSKEVLDDMKEWETDYEKRVALLGFLVSPEGKKAFGALYELAKVHEEQVRLQEEQEKIRQEQLVSKQAHPSESRRGMGSVGASSTGGKAHVGAGGNNMKNKLRAQLNKRKSPGGVPNQTQAPTATTGKMKKSANKKHEEKEDPLLEEAARTLEEAQRQVQEKKRIDALRSHLAASEVIDTNPPGSGRRSEPSKRLSSTAKAEVAVASSPKPEKNNPSAPEAPVFNQPEVMAPSNGIDESTETKPEKRKKATVDEQSTVPKALNDFTKQKEAEKKTEESDVEGTGGSVSVHGKKTDRKDSIKESQLTVPTHEVSRQKEDRDHTSTVIKEENFFSFSPVAEERESLEIEESNQEGKQVEGDEGQVSEPTGVLLRLYLKEIDCSEMSSIDLERLVEEWRLLRQEREKADLDQQNKHQLHHELKEHLRMIDEEKELMRKEKDKFVFKEFELQQKLQEMSQKYKSLREDYDSLKQNHHQMQINNKKSNKLHQEMKKKITKLESKIKSMDKVTVRRGTQTDDHSDKDVHEALRMAEESLSVTQNELTSANSKLKSAQQEVDDYKKQVNIKGREINKRERKSKKDEDTIRIISRERDAMEIKLRKITEQLEYYKSLPELKGKGNHKKSSEKKEVKVQRCASGRHVLIKSVAASAHQHESGHDAGDGSRPHSQSSRPTTVKQSSKSKPTLDKQGAANKKSSQLTPVVKPTGNGQNSSEKQQKIGESGKSSQVSKTSNAIKPPMNNATSSTGLVKNPVNTEAASSNNEKQLPVSNRKQRNLHKHADSKENLVNNSEVNENERSKSEQLSQNSKSKKQKSTAG